MDEITKQTAIRSIDKVYNGGKNYAKENFIKAFKYGNMYIVFLKHKNNVVVMLHGANKNGDYHKLCIPLDLFKKLQELNITAIETLFQGTNNGNEKNL